MNSIATAISNGRTDTSFVDDLNALLGTVNSRVALLLRSIEVHPVAAKMCCSFKRTHPSPFPFYYFSLCVNRTRGCFVDGRGAQVGAHLNTGARARNDIMELWTAVLVWALGGRPRACMRRARDPNAKPNYCHITRLSTICGLFSFFSFIGFPHTRVFQRCPKKSKKHADVTFNRDCTFNRIDRERCLNLARDRSNDIDRYQTHGARHEPRLSRLRSRALGARCAALVAAVRLRRSHRVRPWNVRVVSSRLVSFES